MLLAEPIGVTLSVSAALERLGVDYLVGGSLASSIHGIRVVDFPPSDLNLATAEDMVLQKLIWYREGGSISDRQWGDVRGILRTQGDRLDREYLDRWATRKGLDELLARAFADAGIPLLR